MICRALQFTEGCHYEEQINMWFYRPAINTSRILRFYIQNATSENNRTNVVCTAIQESETDRMELDNATVVIRITMNSKPILYIHAAMHGDNNHDNKKQLFLEF